MRNKCIFDTLVAPRQVHQAANRQCEEPPGAPAVRCVPYALQMKDTVPVSSQSVTNMAQSR